MWESVPFTHPHLALVLELALELRVILSNAKDPSTACITCIDGRLYFHDDTTGKSKQIILSVKGGHVEHSHVRDLRGVLDREGAEIGVIITLEPATKPMLVEAASAGFYKSPAYQDRAFPRIQILTIEEMLAGKTIELPRLLEVTFKQAPKAKAKAAENLTLDLG
jgi:site-specific DNA-methyltransferase (adenine-specific)